MSDGGERSKVSDKGKAVLKGYRLEFNKEVSHNPKEGYANITCDETSIVEGALYEISDADLQKLDKHEGCPTHYYKIKVAVLLDDGGEVEAYTYIANSGWMEEGLMPTKGYLEHLLKAKDILSESYHQKLKSVKTLN